MDRLFFLIVGLLMILVGIDVFHRKSFFYYGADVPLGNSNFVSALIIIFGIILIVFAFMKKIHLTKKEKYYKCIQCGTVFAEDIQEESTCPNCGNEVEDLEGFYDRHPE